MFWDTIAGVYDLFENIYNGKVNKKLCREVAELISAEDEVLECACGTGMLTVSPKRSLPLRMMPWSWSTQVSG